MKFAFAISFTLLFVAYLPVKLYAQDKNIPITTFPNSHRPVVDTTVQTDFQDLVQSIFTKNYKPTKAEVIGRKPIISFVPAVGYSLQTQLAGTLTGNIVFRSSPSSKVSTITTSMGYTAKRQFTLPIVSTIWTHNNNFVFIGDTRFYVYPQSTYGLGSNSNRASESAMRYNLFRFSEIVMKHITDDLFLGIGYKLQQHWNITYKEPANGAPSDYEKYGTSTRSTSSGLSFNALYDSRDNAVNASKGFYAAVQFYSSERILGGNSNWQSLIIDVRKYYKLPASSDNVLAFWSYNWLTLNGKPPYLDLPSTSWDTYSTTGRGYIQSRFRGANMVYLESEYRYKITKNGLLGGVVFLNGESFSAEPGTRLQSVQPGYGLGLRIKLSKVSKTNLDIDYGFGNQGSRGLFLTVGEVF